MANGIIVIDKPAGWTSMDVCAKLRGIYHEKRVGHAGTLDPMATGVLPIFVGRATRAVEFAAGGDKEYIAGLKLGLVTNTQDTTGEVLSERVVQVGREELEEVLRQFTGEIDQVPPMYSAVKIGGKKLYELARKGQEVERKVRRVTIRALELLNEPPFGWAAEEGVWFLRVACSKGTYVRTLCHDIGLALGCGGAMCALRRTRAAGYTLAEAVTLEQLQAAQAPEVLLRGVDTCFGDYPAAAIDNTALRLARNGNPFPAMLSDGTYRIYAPDGEFLLLGECRRGRVSTIKSFFALASQ